MNMWNFISFLSRASFNGIYTYKFLLFGENFHAPNAIKIQIYFGIVISHQLMMRVQVLVAADQHTGGEMLILLDE